MNDPYIDIGTCVARLRREQAKHPRLIVAFDFDDTVFPYHGTDDTHEWALAILRRAQAAGFYLVLFTASDPSRFGEMTLFLATHDIRVDSINENPIPLPFGHHGKLYYNILLDDRAGLGQALTILNTLLDTPI